MNDFRMFSVDLSSYVGELRHFINESSLYGRNAVKKEDTVRFRLHLPRRLGASAVCLTFYADDTGNDYHLPFTWQGQEGSLDVYEAVLLPQNLQTFSSLSYYRIEATTVYGAVYGSRTERFDGSVRFYLSDDAEGERLWQLLIYEERALPPSWLYGSVIYHVFVDRFCRVGDTPIRSDAIWNQDWENGIPQYPPYPGAPLANNMFFGGNLAGIEEKLPYIAALGVGCIYLSPIFEAYSNHKYDTGDYMKIDEMFGGESAFVSLLQKAKEYGIRVILDGVFNHTGADSIYFNRYGRYPSVGAYQSKDSPYFDWYRFQEFPNKYTAWWDIPILPRLFPEVASCRDFFVSKDGVIAHYARMGIGGMRLDVADELSDEFISMIRTRLCEAVPDAVLYGEVWEDASNKIAYGHRRHYYDGTELDGVMNYPLRTGLISFLREGNAEPLRYALCEVLQNCPKFAADAAMNLLGTHDTERILTALAGKERGGRTNDELATARMTDDEYALGVRRLMTAYTILATLPGVPSVFYGDEVGMQGYSDPFNRLPFPWHKIDEEILTHFQLLGQVRKSQGVYRQGEFSLLTLDKERLAFVRFDRKAICLTYVNQGANEQTFSFDAPVTVLVGEGKRKKTVSVSSGASIVLRLTPRALFSLDGQGGIKIPKDLQTFLA